MTVTFCSFGKTVVSNLEYKTDTIKSYKVGDTLPDIAISNLIHHTSTKAKLSDFKGRIIIIDFWATWCIPCLKAMPKLDSVQKKYIDRIKVLSVTSETRETVERFFKETYNKDVKNISLTISTNDLQLRRLFPHNVIPHMIWIDENRVVKAITGGEELNQANIEDMLARSRVKGEEKVDIRYNRQKPMLLGGLPSDKAQLIYKSALTKSIKGLPYYSSFNTKPINGTRSVIHTNCDIPRMYAMALGKGSLYFIVKNRTLVELKDTTKIYLTKKKKDWGSLNKDSLFNISAFCYEIRVPESISSDQMFEMMHQDLNRLMRPLFGIQGNLEKRKVKCYVIVRSDTLTRFATHGGKEVLDISPVKTEVNNIPMDAFIQELAYRHFGRFGYPLINGTRYEENIDLTFDGDLSKLEVIKSQLNKYGLDIIVEEREIDMVVVSDVHD